MTEKQRIERTYVDRRSIRDRRGRWWRFIKKTKGADLRHAGSERRCSSEKRQDWERISKWSSAPLLKPYRYPYLHGLSNVSGYPYW